MFHPFRLDTYSRFHPHQDPRALRPTSGVEGPTFEVRAVTKTLGYPYPVRYPLSKHIGPAGDRGGWEEVGKNPPGGEARGNGWHLQVELSCGSQSIFLCPRVDSGC